MRTWSNASKEKPVAASAPNGGGQRRRRQAMPMCLQRFAQVVQHLTTALPERLYHAQQALHEAASRLALAAVTAFASEHRSPQHPLRRVIRWLYSCHLRERPQRLLPQEDVRARPLCLLAAATHPFQQPVLHVQPRPRQHLLAHRLETQPAFTVAMPQREYAGLFLEQSLADPLPGTASVHHRLKVPLQVRPAQLPLLFRQAVVGAVAV